MVYILIIFKFGGIVECSMSSVVVASNSIDRSFQEAEIITAKKFSTNTLFFILRTLVVHIGLVFRF